jgi:hypothetical protein
VRLSSSRRERDRAISVAATTQMTSRAPSGASSTRTRRKAAAPRREAFGNSAQLCDAVMAGTFERFDQPIGTATDDRLN